MSDLNYKKYDNITTVPDSSVPFDYYIDVPYKADGITPNFDELFQALQHLRHNKHEVILFHTMDADLELNFNFENRPYNLIDMETGEQLKLQPNEFREKYTEMINRYFQEIEQSCLDYRIDFVKADINKGYHDILLAYLIKRQKMK